MNASARRATRVTTLWPTLAGDRSGQVLTLTAATAQVLLPTLWGPRFAENEQPRNSFSPRRTRSRCAAELCELKQHCDVLHFAQLPGQLSDLVIGASRVWGFANDSIG